jgi:NAD(P)-dependent dehydrogenase (short-subunit alcohol dehydrogenase family)
MYDYTPPQDLLAGRVILITGAGAGIGRAAALACAGHGATVVLLGRTIPKLEQVYDAIEQTGGPQPAIYPMNLEGATPKDYQDLADTLGENFGRLDGLLHNAAELLLLSRIDDYDFETWYKVIQVNLNAPFLLTQACLPWLRRSSDASILFTSDRVAREGKAYWGAYGVAKAGLEGLMRILAQETETHSPIRVNSIDPGPVRTQLRAFAFPGEDPAALPPPAAILPLYLWLLGPDSRGHTGHVIDARHPEPPTPQRTP